MRGRIAALSRRGLILAAELPGRDAARLARWLYRFGTAPRTPEAERDFGPGDDPVAVLGLVPGAPARMGLEAAFEATTHTGWIGFGRGKPPAAGAPGSCKLYVSPAPAALATAFPRIAAVFADAGVRAFKVGRGLEGLLRPDKIVAYFDDRAHLEATARALARALPGCPAQGVPFTAELAGDGLLSWGVDPPAGGEAASWRAWVTRRLAAAVVAARPAAARDVADAALRTLAAAGVDPETWAAEPGAFATPASAVP